MRFAKETNRRVGHPKGETAMFGEKPLAARVERIEMGIAQIRADLQRIDRKVETQVAAIRQQLSELTKAIEEMTAAQRR